MADRLTGIVSLALLVALLAFTVPPMVDATQDGTEQRLQLGAGSEGRVTEGLDAIVQDTGQNEATISLEDTESGATTTHTIIEGNTTSYEIAGETLSVELIDSTSSTADFVVNYPRTYSWHPAATEFLRNLPLVLIVLAFVIVTAGFMAVKP